MNLRRWLSPGIGIKRWLLVVFVGFLLLALAVAHTLRQVSRDLEPGGLAGTLIDVATLQFLPYPLRGLIVGGIGVFLVAIGAVRVIRVFMGPFRSADGDQPLVELIYQRRFLARGPRIVAIGGGTGLSMLLRGLKEHTSNLTAVVTVADDGGSSGVLRDELGIPPVGDIRNCIAALADAEPLMSELLQYRFPASDGDAAADGTGLGGHAVGNLLIAAMTAVEGGDFEEGVRRINRILAVRGQVLPATRDAPDAPRPAEGRLGHRRPVADHADGRDRSRLADAGRRPAVRGCARGHRRGRPHRPRTRQPLHEPAAEPADPRHPRGPAGGERPARLRVQRRDPGGRDDRLRPRRARRGADRAHGARARRRRRREQPLRGPSARRTGRPSRSASAGRPRSTRSRASCSRTSSMPTMRTITTRRA